MTPAISFEIFPPKTPQGAVTLAHTVAQLDRVDPAYISVTYGAGGSDRHRSIDAIDVIRSATEAPIAAHITCVGQSRDDVRASIDQFLDAGVRQFVALRGDPPNGIDAAYVPHPQGFTSTAELVAELASHPDVTVSVSAYPERHPQSPSIDHDLDVLAAKVAAGADRAITQMFFDNDRFADYLVEVRSRGITVPIVPGIFPIHCLDSVRRFAQRCGAAIPAEVAARFVGLDDPDERRAVAAEVATEQIKGLVGLGVEHVHLYTLNQPELALAVCERLALATPGGTR